MRIVLAPDSFKESLSAAGACQALELGFREVFPDADYIHVPMADGGEGTTEAIVSATGGSRHPVRVHGPLGDEVEAFFGLTGDGTTAIVEMAAASGLELLPRNQRNPMLTTSYGTGELILKALDTGARHLVVGLGGSATNDAGAGMLTALGVRLLNSEAGNIEANGSGLAEICDIDVDHLDPRLKDCVIDVACDVNNPLTGPEGASATFGLQKGASAEQVEILDQNLARFAALIRSRLGLEMETLKGAGAAGGMGGALSAFLHGNLRPGIAIVAEVVDLAGKIAGADLVVTGEGRIDGQSVHGKTPVGVARVAERYHVPVVAIGGSLMDDAELVIQEGSINAIASCTIRPCSLDEAIACGAENLRRAATRVARLLATGARIAGR